MSLSAPLLSLVLDYVNAKPSYFVPSVCTVDFDIPNLFAVCLTVALVSII